MRPATQPAADFGGMYWRLGTFPALCAAPALSPPPERVISSARPCELA